MDLANKPRLQLAQSVGALACRAVGKVPSTRRWVKDIQCLQQHEGSQLPASPMRTGLQPAKARRGPAEKHRVHRLAAST
jgi:hypothetical protein